MRPTWLVNGEQGAIPPTDRGLAYGDGLFETMAAADGRIRWLDLHLDRMARDCDRLAIDCPDRALLQREIDAVCPANGRGVVKLTVTRGNGGRGYRPPAKQSPTRIVTAHSWPEYPPSNHQNGIRLTVCRTPVGENSILAGIKHLCRLEQVLAQSEIDTGVFQEGLQLSNTGEVVGGTMSNLFLLRHGALTTPRVDRYGVSGVMRSVVLRSARGLMIETDERVTTLGELETADEMFMTNAVFGIWPVREFCGRSYPIGRITRRLMVEIEL